jgi:hypothetical protein
MPKLDSFLKECMRISPFGTRKFDSTPLNVSPLTDTLFPLEEAISRKVVQPFKFSNGIEVPVGMTVSAHQYATHYDENLYPHAGVFDGFRFVLPSDKNKEKAGRDVKGTMYTTSHSYLAFGHGRHAWYVTKLGHSFLALSADYQPS